MKFESVKTFACEPDNVGVARAWLTHQFSGQRPDAPSSAVDDAELVVSELVTNAVRAGGSQVTVHVLIEDECVRIGVEDHAPGTPEQRVAASTDTSGRGLGIVNMVAADWGVRKIGTGKEVWAAIRLT